MHTKAKKSPNILRRCSVCKKYHASYLVPDHEDGPGYYCTECWKARFGPQEEATHEQDMDRLDKSANNPNQNRKSEK